MKIYLEIFGGKKITDIFATIDVEKTDNRTTFGRKRDKNRL